MNVKHLKWNGETFKYRTIFDTETSIRNSITDELARTVGNLNAKNAVHFCRIPPSACKNKIEETTNIHACILE